MPPRLFVYLWIEDPLSKRITIERLSYSRQVDLLESNIKIDRNPKCDFTLNLWIFHPKFLFTKCFFKHPCFSNRCSTIILQKMFFLWLYVFLAVVVSPRPLEARTNESNPHPPVVTFELLARKGASELRLPYPYAELKSINVLPTNLAPSAASSRARDFRRMFIIGQDTRSEEWLRIDNKNGCDQWTDVHEIDTPEPVIQSLTSFQYQDYPISFNEAFVKISEVGLSKPWAVIRLGATGTEPTPPEELEILYTFLEADRRNGVLVDARSGEVRRFRPRSNNNSTVIPGVEAKS